MEFMALKGGIAAYLETNDGDVEFTLPRGMVLQQAYSTKTIRGISFLKVKAASSLDELMDGKFRECYTAPTSLRKEAVDVDALAKNYVRELSRAKQNYRNRKDGELRLSRVVVVAMAVTVAAIIAMFAGAEGVSSFLLAVAGFTVCTAASFSTYYNYKHPNAEMQVVACEEAAKQKYADTIRKMIAA